MEAEESGTVKVPEGGMTEDMPLKMETRRIREERKKERMNERKLGRSEKRG